MLSRKLFSGLLAMIAIASTLPGLVEARDIPVAKNVVLVHGLYADGSSWIDVIPYLQRAGLNVTVVQESETHVVPGFDRRPHDRSRAGAISGPAHEGDNHRT
jgi:hypothetical protein